MGEKETVILTNMCMLRRGDSVLVQDKVNSDWSGITFPGGHVMKDEPCADAVIREMYEETGLTVRSPELCGIKEWIGIYGCRYIAFLYKAREYEGELKPSAEGKVFWVPLDRLPSMRLSMDMEDILRLFLGDEFEYFWSRGKEKANTKENS